MWTLETTFVLLLALTAPTVTFSVNSQSHANNAEDMSNKDTEDVPEKVREAWSQDEFPNPQENVEECGRQGRISWVCDPNGIIKYTEANALDAAVENLRNSTGCPCENLDDTAEDGLKVRNEPCSQKSHRGYIMAIAIVPSIAVSDIQDEIGLTDDKVMMTERQTVKFADYLRSKSWRFGKCNEDIVVVLSVRDSQLHTSAGARARRLLSKERIDEIFDTTKMKFRQGRWADALLVTVTSYRDVLTGQYQSPLAPVVDIDMGLYIGAVSIVVMIGTIICVVCVRSIGQKFKPKRRGLEAQGSGMSAAATPAMSWMGSGGGSQL